MSRRRSSSRILIGGYGAPALRGVVLASTAAMVAGCSDSLDDTPVGRVIAYDNAVQCQTEGLIPAAECVAQEQQAMREHAQFAPQYDSWDDCRADYEQCNSRWEGGRTTYIPRFSGYLIAELIAEAGDAARRRHHAALYRTREGSLMTTAGYHLPGLGHHKVSQCAFDGLSKKPDRREHFTTGKSETTRYGSVGDAESRDAARAYMPGGTLLSCISRGGFGGSSRGFGG